MGKFYAVAKIYTLNVLATRAILAIRSSTRSEVSSSESGDADMVDACDDSHGSDRLKYLTTAKAAYAAKADP